ncbi:hypothetical protein AB0F91_42970 [Amycolatopsis sp. NPDC023774]
MRPDALALYGVAGCANEAAAAAELADHDPTLPDGYSPGAFTRS